MPAAAAVALLDLLEGAGIDVWVDGGWAVDAALGEQTREHADLDVVVETANLPRLRKLLAARGFDDVPRDDTRPWNFVLGDAGGRQIDVHAVTFDERGHGVYGPAENGETYPAEALTGDGVIAGRRVRCVSPTWLVRFRTGYEPRAVDRLDVAALCTRFRLEVPEAYVHGPPVAVAAHLARMRAQRSALFEALADVPEERLWVRPAPKKWSPGEHLDHTRVLNRSFRRLLTVAWPVVSPWPALLPAARTRLERPYATDIDDVYQRPSMPSWVGFLWPPKRTPSRPAARTELERALAEEHSAITRFYADKPEPLLGHVAVWDPAIGRLNLVQVLRVVVHHDQHHFNAVRRQVGR